MSKIVLISKVMQVCFLQLRCPLCCWSVCCLSLGEIRVFCSSEGGDSPRYSWTLDGWTHTD